MSTSAVLRQDLATDPKPELSWHVLWTRSNCERMVCDSLEAKGYELFLPMADQWVADKTGKRICRVPMFRSYIFLHHAVDKYDYLEICNTKGMVGILGASWDRLACIPEQEMADIKRICNSGQPVINYPFLKTGDRVRLVKGSLKNTEGVLVRSNTSEGLLVVSVKLLNRSIAVEVDCTNVVPV